MPDNVLKAAIDYSVQYIPQRSLPDKAIDLVDMTAAHLAAKHPVKDAKEIEAEIKRIEQEQTAAAEKEDYQKAQECKDKIAELKKELADHSASEKVTATPSDVADSVERLTGIPVSKMGASDIERLKGWLGASRARSSAKMKPLMPLHEQFGGTGPALTKVIVQSAAFCSLDNRGRED